MTPGQLRSRLGYVEKASADSALSCLVHPIPSIFHPYVRLCPPPHAESGPIIPHTDLHGSAFSPSRILFVLSLLNGEGKELCT